MKRLILQPLVPELRFRHRGKPYYLRSPGIDAVGLVREVTMNPTSLLRLRRRIQRVIERPAPVALSHCLDTAHSPLEIRFIVWLLGQMGSQYAMKSVAARAWHPDPRVRAEVVRSLRRMRAWHALHCIEVRHWDPWLRAQATPHEPLPFKERLEAFAVTCSDQTASRTVQEQKGVSSGIWRGVPSFPTDRDRELVLSPDLQPAQGRPPRSPYLIARVLRRIRRLVRRPVRHRGWRWFLGEGRCFRRSHG